MILRRAVVSLMALVVLAPTCALDAKCNACQAVMSELLERLEKERPRNHLDMRHRLDKDGKRYGKVIDYKVSELRMLELLEDLCKELDAYEYQQPTDADPEGTWSRQLKPNKSAGELTQAHQLTKQLVNYCHLFLEEHEEQIMKLIRDGAAPADLTRSVCERLSGVCEAMPSSPQTDEL